MHFSTLLISVFASRAAAKGGHNHALDDLYAEDDTDIYIQALGGETDTWIPFQSPTNGTFCFRRQHSKETWVYAMQIESEEKPAALCEKIKKNIESDLGKCSTSFTGKHGCKQKGEPRKMTVKDQYGNNIKDPKDLTKDYMFDIYTTWWWWATYNTCQTDHPTWHADRATRMDLNWVLHGNWCADMYFVGKPDDVMYQNGSIANLLNENSRATARGQPPVNEPLGTLKVEMLEEVFKSLGEK